MPIRCRFQRSTSTTPATNSPADPRNLELSLRDVDAKGCLDLELLYQLKEKEKVRGIEKENADWIEHSLEEGTPVFQRVFEDFYPRRCGFYLPLPSKRKPTPDEGGGFWCQPEKNL